MRSDCGISRIAVAALSVALMLCCAPIARPIVFAAVPVSTAAEPPHQAPETQGEAQGKPGAHPGAGTEESEPNGAWLPLIAKVVNFSLLVAVLTYFLRTPLAGYLASRITKIRQDLVTAAEMREAATRQLAEIEAKLKALPAELEALKVRGAEEIAAEQIRIQETAEIERQRLLEHTRRQIEIQVRMAKRELIELAATLAVAVAGERIQKTITPEDQARLVDRYAAQLQAVQQGGRS